MEQQSLQDLCKVAKPYALAQDVTSLDVGKPLVRSVGHVWKRKLELFFDIIILIQVVLVLVRAGESKKCHLQWLCKAMLDLIKTDLLSDIEPESMVTALSQLQTVLLGLHAVVDGSWQAFDAFDNEISFLRKPPSGLEHVVQIANAMTVDDFYRQQLKQFQNMKEVMTVHESSLGKLRSFLEFPECEGSLAAAIAVTEERWKDFTDLKYHLPEGALDSMSDALDERLQSLWKRRRHDHAEPSESSCGASEVQSLPAEGAIAFPEAEWLAKAQEEFSHILHAKTGAEDE